eukprot:GHUV01052473.1.p1 GENE.GHUV01052473.1~~GHUV01052473.1.p1  ORF type:complete len:139 (-),score=14.52 GHUV01052473.1:50-466(-)
MLFSTSSTVQYEDLELLCLWQVVNQSHSNPFNPSTHSLQVSEYAASKRVVLKGDLPIGVDKRSVDTWMEPHLFRMDKSTGSPPDFFDPNGQNWGFPTYNWEAMAEDDYLWWALWSWVLNMSVYTHDAMQQLSWIGIGL